MGGEAEGAVTLGDITVGPGLPLDDDFSVGIASATSITVGDVSGPGHVGFATFGDLTTGNLTGRRPGDDPGRRRYRHRPNHHRHEWPRLHGRRVDVRDRRRGQRRTISIKIVVLALDPVPTGGSIAIGGPVVTGLFQAAAAVISQPRR